MTEDEQSFEEKFPELKELDSLRMRPMLEGNTKWHKLFFDANIEEHCLSKQRVEKAILKHGTCIVGNKCDFGIDEDDTCWQIIVRELEL